MAITMQVNTHSPIGSAAASARPRLPSWAGLSLCRSPAAEGGPAEPATPTGTALLVTRQNGPQAAVNSTATTKDSTRPGLPTMNCDSSPENNGPAANPDVSATPARAAPLAGSWSLAHAVPALITSATPTPTTSRPSITPNNAAQPAMSRLPAVASASPVSTIVRRPYRSESPPPTSNPGSRPRA